MKYRLTDETKIVDDHILHRIECVTPFSYIEAGEKGGWVESEDNLSQEGECWIADEAMCYDNAWVCDDVFVYDNVRIYGFASVTGNAHLEGNAMVYDDANVSDFAKLFDNVKVYGETCVKGLSIISGQAEISSESIIDGNAYITDDAVIEKDSDYIVMKDILNGEYLTYTASNGKWGINGLFSGDSEALIKYGNGIDESTGKLYEAMVEYVNKVYSIDFE